MVLNVLGRKTKIKVTKQPRGQRIAVSAWKRERTGVSAHCQRMFLFMILINYQQFAQLE